MSLIITDAPMTKNEKTDPNSGSSNNQNRVNILDYLEGFILHAPYRKKPNGEVGLRKSTLHTYTNFRLHLQRFLKDHQKNALHFTDLNRQTVESFTRWLLEERKFSQNHSGRILATLKTLARDAKKNEIAVHPFIKHISGFSQQSHKRVINILNFTDLRKIEAVCLEKKHLENVRSWLIIGFWIGQRVSDLLTLTPHQLRSAPNGGLYVDIHQQKTDKKVTVGVIDPLALEILRHRFPKKLLPQRFNKYLKIVLHKAGIDEMVTGFKFNAKTQRKELGIFPKYHVISSHDLRRSFATNFFGKIPTPILMNMTGHTKESTFMGYIGRDPNRDSYADAFMEGVKRM
ncbi:MAG: phage integrase SAM-like domain-containing protein [Flavobacteriaceae bacterium]|jgi:integrase